MSQKNSKIKDLLQKCRSAVHDAKEHEEIEKVLDTLQSFHKTHGAIAFDHSGKWIASFVGLVLFIAYVASLYYGPGLISSASLTIFLGKIALGIVLLGFIFLSLIMVSDENAGIERLADTIFDKDIALDNNLTLHEKTWHDGEKYESYAAQFFDFERGDEDHTIQRIVEGSYSKNGYTFDYEYYTFRYVRVYYVPVTTKVGNTTMTTMQRRTETLYRYGIVTDFDVVRSIAVCSSVTPSGYEETWKTTSSDFNDYFSVHAKSTQEAVQFLKPAVVLAFLAMAPKLDDMNCQINSQGRMNISFSDDVLFSLLRVHGLDEPDAFAAEIAEHREITRFTEILDFICALRKYNDKNF